MEAAPNPPATPRATRIRESREFLRLKSAGQRLTRGSLVANWTALPAGSQSQFGVIAAKRLGPAVVRNRAKRWMRETFRRNLGRLSTPVSMVLVARRDLANPRYGLTQVERDFAAILRQAGLWSDAAGPAPAPSNARR